MQLTIYPQTVTLTTALAIMRAEFGHPPISDTELEAVLLVETLRFELNLGRYVRPQQTNGKLTWQITDDAGQRENSIPRPSASALAAALEHGWVCMAGECLTVTVQGLRRLDRLRLRAGFTAFERDWDSELSDESTKTPYEWDLPIDELARLRLLEALTYYEQRSAFCFIAPVDGTSFRTWGYTLRGPLGYPACVYPSSVLQQLQAHNHIRFQGNTVRITEAGWSWYYLRTLELERGPVFEEEAIDWDYVLCRGKVPLASLKALLKLQVLYENNDLSARA
ncbi:hypothetical protein U746_2801 [Mycolicibacterium mucogenicum 261Sha1.1M5]|uniref:hypothetical protein n=1 Tax=Leucobacter aridicollis TaxID=283878 RepID=UPI000EB464D1|nr:hypothetical protein [Leucobacter aridicollis]MCS3427589.1 hypothetical protein [Leucobacter aridicollis]RKQ84568.1 hypothetical protein U746_2801 [Mycolicibacterium mucogenicum 261Sha1.1M5]